ncbi:LamB/YcsF family protein [Brackiella oedipodis]|uniref:LamB/YcsF family protein n=1 Tax=Brackiella oedipodis TaxID=124225 RepID=UPI00048FDC36|nr:5-oxoprolinase subunit PxpA [Brackiella oedipodis]
MSVSIDLNSDLGEHYGAWRMGHDDLILPIVSSANIACGFHAGDPSNLLQTLQTAQAQQVAVGAHVAYPDLVGFGRRSMQLSYEDLKADVIYQIAALQGLAKVAGTQVRYVKPHGALYNTIAHDAKQAQAVIDGMLALDDELILMALAGSPLIDWAQNAGLKVVAEAFADRNYEDDGRLVSRQHPQAVIHDAKTITERMIGLVKEGGVYSINGKFIPLAAQSICVHGDTEGAVNIAKALRQGLQQAGIRIQAFSTTNK